MTRSLLMFLLFLCPGCATRIGEMKPLLRSELLATEQARLSELTDPVSRTKSYITISEVLLSFASDDLIGGGAMDARHGDPENVRGQAIQMYLGGMNLPRIGRHLGLHRQTISLWVKSYTTSLPIWRYSRRYKRPKWTNCLPLSVTRKPHL